MDRHQSLDYTVVSSSFQESAVRRSQTIRSSFLAVNQVVPTHELYHNLHEHDYQCIHSGDERIRSVDDTSTDQAYNEENTEDIIRERSPEKYDKNKTSRFFKVKKGALEEYLYQHNQAICKAMKILAAIGFTLFLIFALIRNFSRASLLLQAWIVVVVFAIIDWIHSKFALSLVICCLPLKVLCITKQIWFKSVFAAVLIIAQIVWIMKFETFEKSKAVAVIGYLAILFIVYITSKHRRKIKWRPVLLGLLCQYLLAVFILRYGVGYYSFLRLGEFAETLFDFSNAGSKFVFGSNYMEHRFAFAVLPVRIYSVCAVSVLYYLGLMQWLLRKLSWIMEFTLKASAAETVVVMGNIMGDFVQSTLLVEPYLNHLTKSELLTIITSGMATISAGNFALLVQLDVEPMYFIVAIFMSAPCALALAKLSYPETEKSKFDDVFEMELEPSSDRSIFEAVLSGVSRGVPMILNMASFNIVCLSLLSAAEAILIYCGSLLDHPLFSFEELFSYILFPLVWSMGVESTYALEAGRLISVKVFRDDLEAYGQLKILRDNRDIGTMPEIDPFTGKLNWMDEKSEAIVSFALCGFGNFGSIAIFLGAISALIPERTKVITSLAFRGLLTGIAVSLLNACIVDYLLNPIPIACDKMLSATNWTYTEPSRLFECCSKVIKNTSATNNIIACNCCNYDWNSTDYALNCTSLIC